MTEYELQLIEYEIIFEEMEKGQYLKEGQKEDYGKSCRLGVLIAIGFFVIIYVIIALIGN